MTQPTMEETNRGDIKMSALQDREMERLSDLLAQGTLSNARDIARLLRVELGTREHLTLNDEGLLSYLGLFWPDRQ